MLSIENPLSDLLCSAEISQLKSSSSDERASDKLADLLKSSPKFTIRDYVFSARSKDIRTNWPFSQKKLQLCLKHDMKDLLPRFEPLDSVRNQLIKKCPIEPDPINKENTTNNSDEHSESIGYNNAGFTENVDTDFVSINPEINSDAPVKKCRLIVKLGNEENMSNLNCVTVTETIASKMCPVCKTFTSSSNTTLNAHIDQCLSVESPVKVIKHRVKPRKTRLMVDIYSTAPHCTLEELDRRNGTSLAMNTLLNTQKNEVCDEEKRHRVSSVNIEDTADENHVYVDANGTKVRVLSNFNELSMSKEVLDSRIHKILEGGKRNKFLSVHKKNLQVKKHRRYMNLDPRSKKLGSLMAHRGSEIHRDLERNCAAEESHEKEEHLGQPFQPQQQIKLSDSRHMRKRVCTKQTGVSKKAHYRKNLQHLGYNLRQDLRMESDLSSLDNSRIENSSYEAEANQKFDQPPLDSFGSRISKKMHVSVESKRRSERLGKDSEDDCGKGLSRENLSAPKNKPVEVNADSSWKSGASSLKATKFSTLRKKFSVKKSSVPESEGYINGKYRAPEKPRVDWVAKVDEQPLQNRAKNQVSEEITEQVPLGSRSALIVRKKRAQTGNSTDTFDDIESAGKRVRSRRTEDIITEPATKVAVGVAVISSIKPSDPEFQCADVFTGTFYGPSEPSLGDGEEMYGPDVSPNTHFEAELESNIEQENYFSEVDPIPIPGPPGSFLPSPRGMSPEDLQGNSSLTTTRIQSSEDHHDRDSSDSPVSAISAICNSAAIVRSDSKSSEELASVGLEKVNLDDPKGNVTISEKEQPLGFRNDQPCYCSRKEGTKQGLALNFKESQLLQRRAMCSMPLPMVLKQTGSDQTERISEKAVSSDSALNFSIRGYESGNNPSPSNSVLRLMGKDLMVINRDEDSSPKLGESHSGVPYDNPNPQNQLIFGQNQDFDVGSSKSFNSHVASLVVFPRILELPHEYQPDTPRTHNMDYFLANTNTQHPNAPIPMISSFDVRKMDPYYVGSSPVVDNASFRMPSFRTENLSPFKGSCTSDGSSAFYPRSLMASSATVGDLRSSKFSMISELCFMQPFLNPNCAESLEHSLLNWIPEFDA